MLTEELEEVSVTLSDRLLRLPHDLSTYLRPPTSHDPSLEAEQEHDHNFSNRFITEDETGIHVLSFPRRTLLEAVFFTILTLHGRKYGEKSRLSKCNSLSSL
ncbi:hypothetical protein E2C01_022079 [Portunus trituberculatus]|uniref:Uncharacterized protein n=1 Tax=Portunus trituberculatus TaxID=210409 RepID=A0A5B7E6M0_PORTR|nr:hypothetical protein [Portunus trituberculatus]